MRWVLRNSESEAVVLQLESTVRMIAIFVLRCKSKKVIIDIRSSVEGSSLFVKIKYNHIFADKSHRESAVILTAIQSTEFSTTFSQYFVE